MNKSSFSLSALELDYSGEAEKIATVLHECVLRRFRKKGVVVALSGGIDSSVVGALSVKALGREQVLGLLMPERESSSETLPLSRQIAEHLGIKTVHEDISTTLEAVGCYKRRDDALRLVVPEYGVGWRAKIVLPNLLEDEGFRIFSAVVEDPGGNRQKVRLSLDAYLGIVAASNFKQRVRKMLEYYHADRLNYAVTGTPNRLEYDQGFFVKLGDGAADIKPIAHLYKTQVYQMAEFLNLPDAIRKRAPTTDTYSLPQSQEEFYFSVPYDTMDSILFAKNHGFSPSEVCSQVGLTEKQVGRVFRDIEAKRHMAAYLHSHAVLVEEAGSMPASH